MDIQECLAAASEITNAIVCKEDTWLSTVESLLVIGSSIAVIAAAIFAYVQLSHMKIQIVTGKDGVIQQINTTKDTAFQQITAGRKDNKLVTTLNLLMSLQTDQYWRESRLGFIELRENEQGLRMHAGKDTKAAMDIRAQLNRYELIAIGIDHDILDEDMFRNYYRGTVLKDWNACSHFVDEERRENENYWSETEKLVDRFKVIASTIGTINANSS